MPIPTVVVKPRFLGRTLWPAMIGEFGADDRFNIVYQSKALPPKAWSPYVEASKGRVADWSCPGVCGGCTTPKYGAMN